MSSRGAQDGRRGDAIDLASYNLVDGQTNQVVMIMRVYTVVTGKEAGDPQANLEAYAAKLVPQLAADQDFTVTPGTGHTITVAGKQVLDLRGSVGKGSVQRFRRDIWITSQPGAFVVLQFVGPIAQRDGILTASQGVINSVQFFDAAAIVRSHEQGRRRAEVLLAKLTPQHVLSCLARQDYWMGVMRGDQVIGFMHFTESIVNQGKSEGIHVLVQSANINDDGSRTLSRQDLYSEADRTNERCDLLSATYSGDKEVARSQQSIVRQHDKLVVQTVTGPSSTKSQVKDMPENISLPMAFSLLLPRILNGAAAAEYAFAQYDPASDDVAMRLVAAWSGQRQSRLPAVRTT